MNNDKSWKGSQVVNDCLFHLLKCSPELVWNGHLGRKVSSWWLIQQHAWPLGDVLLFTRTLHLLREHSICHHIPLSIGHYWREIVHGQLFSWLGKMVQNLNFIWRGNCLVGRRWWQVDNVGCKCLVGRRWWQVDNVGCKCLVGRRWWQVDNVGCK